MPPPQYSLTKSPVLNPPAPARIAWDTVPPAIPTSSLHSPEQTSKYSRQHCLHSILYLVIPPHYTSCREATKRSAKKIVIFLGGDCVWKNQSDDLDVGSYPRAGTTSFIMYTVHSEGTWREYVEYVKNTSMLNSPFFEAMCSSRQLDLSTHPPTPRTASRRACQGSFREHRSDSAKTEDIVCGIRSTYGGGASATEGDV